MLAWWESLTQLERGLAFFAVPSTLILVLQTILLLFGMGNGADGDADGHDFDHMMDHEFDHDMPHDVGHEICDVCGDVHDGGADFDVHDAETGHTSHDPGLRIFTVRGFVAFFSVFGWLGIVLSKQGIPTGYTLTFSVMAGLLAMIAVAAIMKSALSLQSAGNLEIQNAIGKTGRVYIPIPPKRSGSGKVQLIVQVQLRELEAVTDAPETLSSGKEVIAVAASNRNVLVVRPK